MTCSLNDVYPWVHIKKILFNTVMVKARGQGKWLKLRKKPSTKKKATH